MVDTHTEYGASADEWFHLEWVIGLTDDLLPVVSNPNAKISPLSKMKSVGKVPSYYNRTGAVIGYPDWTQHTTTSQEIASWKKQPDYGACIQTRTIPALDVDVPDQAKAAKINAVIQKHFRVPVRWRGNSGKCLHAFRMPGRFGKRVMKVEGGQIEFLANGQHFVACGHHSQGYHYQWLHFDENGAHKVGLPEDFPTITEEQFEACWAEMQKEFAIAAPTKEKATVRQQAEDDKEKMLNDDVLIYLNEHGLVLGVNRDNSVNIECPWKNTHTRESGETETTYFPAGGRGYQQGHFKCLHAHCAERTDQEFLTDLGYYGEMFENVETEETKKEDEVKRNRFGVVWPEDFFRRPPPSWLIKGILPRGETMIFGASGSGKTFAALDLALCLAMGIDWNGHKTKRSKVAYVCAEGTGGFKSRVQAWCKRRGIDPAQLKGWFGIIPDTPNFLDKKDPKDLADKINEAFDGHCDFIVIDTLAQVTTGADENSAKDMGIALRHARYVAALTHAGYALVHHTGKDEDKGPRGSTVMRGALDCMIYISREDERRKIWIDKMKDGKDGFGYTFDLENEVVGEDEDGDAVTSCVVVFTGAAKSKKKQKDKKRGRWQAVALSAWETLGGGNCTVDALLAEALSTTTAEKGKRDRREEYIRIALESLAQDKMFVLRDNAIIIDELES